MSDFVSIEKLSLVDYDGKIACTLFTESCNFRCPFCHNKDLALSNANANIPFEEVLAFLKTRVNKLEGVVITGGEPTLMFELADKIKAIKDLGFLVKLDTNGYKPETLEYLINNKLVDYVAMDIKNSLDKYDLTTGINNIKQEKILKSISVLKEGKVDYEFRTTLVKEFHNINDIKEIANLLKGAKKYFLQKYVANENCINKFLNHVDYDTVKEFESILKENIDFVGLRGY